MDVGKRKKATVCDIGVYEKGRHSGSNGALNSPGYKLWQRMLLRCYNAASLRDRPTYTGCSVHEDFHYFQSFMDWATEQVGYGKTDWALDKDLLVKGNKIYCPALCVFVPRQVNQIINTCKGPRRELPIGVHEDRRYKGKYYAMITGTADVKQRRLGTYSTTGEAFAAYKTAKESAVKAISEEYRDVVDARVYNALVNYEVGYGD